ncbi:MFS transporter [Microbacterium sp.]|uniref:MFS transporter n=1 Tax=Microbacterium sp. TaxID=51671 RepID=UPI003C7708DD
MARDDTRSGGFAALLWLSVANFSMGIDGYVLTGLLPQIAGDLRVDEAAAGQLMSVFALTSAVAGPLLGALTGRFERKRTIAVALAVFAIGNLVVAVAPTYGWAMSGRVISAVGGALLSAVVAAYVIAISAPERRGRALSVVMGGFLAATALGVPVGLLIGEENWRLPLFIVFGIGVLALIGILINVPTLHLPSLPLRETLRPLTRGPILLALLVPVGLMGASYLCFTYASLIVGSRTGLGLAMVGALFGYGIFSLGGNMVAGRWIDRGGPDRVITTIIVALIGFMLLGTAGLGLTGAWGIVSILVWFFGTATFNGGSGISLQARLAMMAPDSVALVVALNTSGMMLGSAIGSATGGAVLAAGLPADALVPLASVFLTLSLVVHLLLAHRVDRRPVL